MQYVQCKRKPGPAFDHKALFFLSPALQALLGRSPLSFIKLLSGLGLYTLRTWRKSTTAIGGTKPET